VSFVIYLASSSRWLVFHGLGVFAQGGCAVALGPMIKSSLASFQIFALSTPSPERFVL
jgi:hypothetical protein